MTTCVPISCCNKGMALRLDIEKSELIFKTPFDTSMPSISSAMRTLSDILASCCCSHCNSCFAIAANSPGDNLSCSGAVPLSSIATSNALATSSNWSVTGPKSCMLVSIKSCFSRSCIMLSMRSISLRLSRNKNAMVGSVISSTGRLYNLRLTSSGSTGMGR